MFETFIAKNPRYIQFIWRPSEALQLIAVRAQPHSIANIKYPTEAVQMAAIEALWILFCDIKAPCFKAQQYMLLNHPGFISVSVWRYSVNWDPKILSAHEAQRPYHARFRSL